MHFNPGQPFIETGFMREVRDPEFAAEFPVNARQQIQIGGKESGSDDGMAVWVKRYNYTR